MNSQVHPVAADRAITASEGFDNENALTVSILACGSPASDYPRRLPSCLSKRRSQCTGN
uniref:Copine domain-containing protein n=1 Tax=Heterorhabditis bacteriophora TaxID=37862 RepID=A0A1I7WTN8_HETBA